MNYTPLQFYLINLKDSRYKQADWIIISLIENRPQRYKTFPMLNSAEHKIYPTHKY